MEKPSGESIQDNINAKYANKVYNLGPLTEVTMLTALQVIQKIGLCICIYDILNASDGLIGHGTGIVNVNGRPRDFSFEAQMLKVPSRISSYRLPSF